MVLHRIGALALSTRARAVPNHVRAFASATGLASVAGALASVLRPLGAGYVVVAAAAIIFQRSLQYFPDSEHPGHPRLRGSAFAAVEEQEIVAADGTKIHLWHLPAPTADEPPRSWTYLGPDTAEALLPLMRRIRERQPALGALDVIQFHGNAGNRAHRLPWMHLLREGLGCSVTIVDYRGFGGSEGKPTERGLISDGAAAYQWLRERQQRQQPPLGGRAAGSKGPSADRRPVLWGESIGSGVAVALLAEGVAAAEHRPILVLEAGFSSCVDIAASAYPFLPVRLPAPFGMLDRFESAERGRRMAAEGRGGVPTLSLHGTLDEIAPIELGRQLFEALPSPRKQFVELESTGHNDVPYRDPARYLSAVADFLRVEDDH
jgi:fermentation-respiration switch protein FrsA (DUF1100 family)